MLRSEIKSFKFYIPSNKITQKKSFSPVVKSDLTTESESGLYDLHMGVSDYEHTCKTCKKKNDLCLGHPGHLKLNLPLFSPLFITEIIKWLKIVCHNCGFPVIDIAKIKSLSGDSKILSSVCKRSTTKVVHIDESGKKYKDTSECSRCNFRNPKIEKSKNENYIIFKILETGREEFYPFEVAKIFDRITCETIKLFGRNEDSHPRNMIIDTMTIPPNTIRPNAKRVIKGKDTIDDLNVFLQMIIQKNNALRSVGNVSNIRKVFEDQKLARVYGEMAHAFDNYVYVPSSKQKGKKSNNLNTGNKVLISIMNRHTGKSGRLRGNQSGKRTRHSARFVITCNSNVPLDTVIIPETVAKQLTLKVVVSQSNIAEMYKTVMNGQDGIDGCVFITVKKENVKRFIDVFREKAGGFKLEPGDILHRHLRDGDFVLVNRQPSLDISSLSAVKVKIDRNGNNSMQINPAITTAFNGDFDGDEMNVHVPKTEDVMIELKLISDIKNMFKKAKNSTPRLGQIHDSIVGSTFLTSEGVKFDRFAAEMLFNGVNLFPKFGTGTVTGKEVFSKVIPSGINYHSKPKFYNKKFEGIIDYTEDEKEVIIEDGKLIKGILDAGAVGPGSENTLNQLVFDETDKYIVFDFLHHTQQIAIRSLQYIGITMGVDELIVSKKLREVVGSTIDSLLIESEIITKKLDNRVLIPPRDSTLIDHYESLQIQTLSDEFNVIVSEMKKSNNFYMMMATGSKGKWNHLSGMVAAVGQIIIGGNRPGSDLVHERVLPFFHRFSKTPESKGFIKSAYIDGINIAEYFFHAMSARRNISDQAVGTAKAGTIGRESVLSTGNQIVNNQRMVMCSGIISQLICYSDCLDPGHLTKVPFKGLYDTDAKFKDRYLYRPKSPDTSLIKILEEDYAKIVVIRDEFRNMIKVTENLNINFIVYDKIFVPIDIGATIHTFIKNNRTGSSKLLIELIRYRDEEIKKLGYLLLNEDCHKAGINLLDYHHLAVKSLEYHIRLTLIPKILDGISMNTLKFIIERIKTKYLDALIAPGSCIGVKSAKITSESGVQAYLDSKHSMSSSFLAIMGKQGEQRLKELYSVKKKVDTVRPQMMMEITAAGGADIIKIAKRMESLSLEELGVDSDNISVNFENIDKPLILEEKQDIAKFIKDVKLGKKPKDLFHISIRFKVSMNIMKHKHINTLELYQLLSIIYPDMYIIFKENENDSIFRIYIREIITLNDAYKKLSYDDYDTFKVLSEEIRRVNLRGISCIRATVVSAISKSELQSDGSFKKVKKDVILTNGSDILEVASKVNLIDRNTIATDSIEEIYNIFGITGVKHKLLQELRYQMPGVNLRHHLCYVNEICSTIEPTPMGDAGMKQRRPTEILLQAVKGSPVSKFVNAAIAGVTDNISGVFSPLIVGSIPKIGTMYNDIIIAEDRIVRGKDIDREIDEL